MPARPQPITGQNPEAEPAPRPGRSTGSVWDFFSTHSNSVCPTVRYHLPERAIAAAVPRATALSRGFLLCSGSSSKCAGGLPELHLSVSNDECLECGGGTAVFRGAIWGVMDYQLYLFLHRLPYGGRWGIVYGYGTMVWAPDLRYLIMLSWACVGGRWMTAKVGRWASTRTRVG